MVTQIGHIVAKILLEAFEPRAVDGLSNDGPFNAVRMPAYVLFSGTQEIWTVGQVADHHCTAGDLGQDDEKLTAEKIGEFECLGDSLQKSPKRSQGTTKTRSPYAGP